MEYRYHFEEVLEGSYSNAVIKASPAGDTEPDIYLAVIEGEEIRIPAEDDGEYYTEDAGGKTVIWNRVDSGHDFCYALWQLLGEPDGLETEGEDEDGDAVDYWSYDFYDQIRHFEPKSQLVNVFRKLESSGYIRAYTVKPRGDGSRRKLHGKSDGSIDAAVVDLSFKEDPQLMEQIEQLLQECPDTELVEVMAECASQKGDGFISIVDFVTNQEYKKRELKDPAGFESSISDYISDNTEKFEEGILEARRLIGEGKQTSVRDALFEVYGYYDISFFVYEVPEAFDSDFNLEGMIYDALEELYYSIDRAAE